MAQKTHDLAVKTGEYTNAQGENKGRWQNVGALMQGDDGGQFIALSRWFNPAGLPNPEGREGVLISCFPKRDSGGDQLAQSQPEQTQQPPQDYQDDVPF